MFKRVHNFEEDTDLDMTSLLDVVFIVLIFFIVTANFSTEYGLPVNTPPQSEESQSVNNSVVIKISETGQVFMSNRQIDIRSLKASVIRVIAESPETVFSVRVESRSRTARLIEVLDGLSSAGIVSPPVSLESKVN